MNIDRIIAIVSILIGIATGYYFYINSRINRDLSYDERETLILYNK